MRNTNQHKTNSNINLSVFGEAVQINCDSQKNEHHTSNQSGQPPSKPHTKINPDQIALIFILFLVAVSLALVLACIVIDAATFKDFISIFKALRDIYDTA